MPGFTIMRLRHEGAGATKRKVWEREPGHADYATHADARRALMVALDPGLRHATDDHIKHHWTAWARNVQQHKIVRS